MAYALLPPPGAGGDRGGGGAYRMLPPAAGGAIGGRGGDRGYGGGGYGGGGGGGGGGYGGGYGGGGGGGYAGGGYGGGGHGSGGYSGHGGAPGSMPLPSPVAPSAVAAAAALPAPLPPPAPPFKLPAGATESDGRIMTAPVRLLTGHAKKVSCLAWAADGSYLASGSSDTTVRLWKVDAAPAAVGREVKILRCTAAVEAVAWHPKEAHVLVAACSDRQLRFWDTRGAGRTDQTLALPTGVYHLAWRRDGGLLAVGSKDDELLLIDTSGAKPTLASRTPIGMQLNEIGWAPSGLLLAAASSRTGHSEEGVVIALQAADGGKAATKLAAVVGHTAAANALRVEPSTGAYFATGGSDATVCLWDTTDFAVVRTFDRLETIIRGLAFSHDGSYLATASDDKVIEIIRVADGSRVRGLPQVDPVNAVAWAPSGHVLAFAADDDRAPLADKYAVRVMLPGTK